MNGPDPTDPSPTGATGPVETTILGRFRVERVLGRGGMGEVLLARDTVLHRRVALKRLRADDAAGPGRRSAILREARRASQVGDHRIAAIYDVLDLNDDVLIVMEYVDGTTLRERMAGPMPLEAFLRISTQCVEAVGAAHAHGIVHRDIKPENLMLTGDGRIKILDFGIARRPDAPPGADPTLLTTMTAEGHRAIIAGTPQYMSPEAHYGGRIDARADIFSLGTVFYELLTGRNPFAGPDYASILERVMTGTPPPVSDLRPAAGAALSRVIARMMARDPADRQASCDQVLRELAAAGTVEAATDLATGATGAPARAVPGRLPRGVVIAVAAVATVAVSWGIWRTTVARALQGDRNLAILAPVTAGATDDFANFALGAVEILGSRLQKHQGQPGFQLASFDETIAERVRSAEDARKVQGATLALIPVMEQGTDAFGARLELWDAVRGRRVASRTIRAPASQPFRYLDRLYREAAGMLGLPPRPGDAEGEIGVRGAGTLRFLLQGVGRLRSARGETQARQAVAELELACRTEPEAAVALAWLAIAQRRCATLLGDRSWLDRAETSAREAVGLDSSRAEPHRALGLVLVQKGDAENGLLAFRRACERNPMDDDTYSRLGRAFGRVGRAGEERDAYRAAVALRPHCWQPYWWLATWHFRQGRFDESVLAFEQMVRQAPHLYRGYSHLGGVLVLRGEYDRAVGALRHSLDLRPTKTAFDNLGTAYFNSGRLNEAVEAYNQAFQFGFAEYDSWLNLGDAYFWLRGRGDQASEAYAQAVKLGREKALETSRRGGSPDVMIPANLATVFPKLGQPDSARVYLARALAADSANPSVQVCAALTCWQLGETRQAVRWLERSVRGGYPPAWIRDSPVFREWRDAEGFRAVVAGAGQHPHPGASPN